MAAFDPMAGSQINVDPALTSPRSRGKAARQRQIYEQLIASGMSPAKAEMEAARAVVREEAESQAAEYDAANPNWRAEDRSGVRQKWADQGQASAEMMPPMPEEVPQWKLDMQAEQEAAQLQSDLSQGGYGQRMVPGPRGIDGRAPMGKPFASVEDAQEYEVRQQMDNGGFGDSQRDQDMRARGFSPVIGPGGNATYMLTGTEHSRIPGAPGRAGERPDLAGKYRIDYRQGISGDMVPVMVPTEKFKVQMKEQDGRVREAQDKRNPYKDLASPADRMKRFLAQVQLGGGRQTPQSIQLETMLNGMTDEQRQQAMRYMAPGGQLAAGVDAQNMQNANEIIKRFMTSGAAGLLPNPAVQAQVQQQQVVHRAGREDDLGELYAPSGMFSYNEFTPDEQESMYNDLIAEGYTDAEARAAVNRQAHKRRASVKKYGAAPAPSASPPAVVPPGSVPPI